MVSVEVAPDLKSCKAWISVLGDEAAREDTWQGLKSAEGFIRRQLARTINLRNTPEITFVMDQSIEYGVNMSRRIDEVMKTGAYEDIPGSIPAGEENEAVFAKAETEDASADENSREE